MYSNVLSDLDELVLRCRDGKARSYLTEAVTCLKAGACRAAIVVTWVAVVHDLLSKLEELALGGDNNAQQKVEAFHRIVEQNDLPASLEFERNILEVARDEFELFSSLTYVDLARLRDDRNRCAHPSMLNPDTDYRPAPELARTHVVNAVTHLLEHGPAQGKAALERLLSELDRTLFPETVEQMAAHLQHGPLGRPRKSLVRNYTVVLLKRYFAKPPEEPDDPMGKLRAQNERRTAEIRILRALQGVLMVQRELTLAALGEKLSELVTAAPEARLSSVVGFFASIPESWSLLPQPQVDRLNAYVRSMPPSVLDPTLRSAWLLPGLTKSASQRLNRLDSKEWRIVAGTPGAPAEWFDVAWQTLLSATSWSEANRTKAFVVRHANRITEAHVTALISAAQTNEELQTSYGAKDTFGAVAQPGNLGFPRLRELLSTAGIESAYSDQHWWVTSDNAGPS